MLNFLELPEIECPRCGLGRLRSRDGSFGSRALLFLNQSLLRLARRLLGQRYWCRACRTHVVVPRELPRTVVGYHGCDRTFAQRLVSGRLTVHDWIASEREFDWLGKGVYFWEHAPGRAWQWAEEHHPGEEAVVAVEVQLGRCLDLADTAFTPLLREAYNAIREAYEAEGRELPKNAVGRDRKARRLDCLVLNHLMTILDSGGGVQYQTIRCPFEEGEAAFPDGNIRVQSHVQIAVRDLSCLSPKVHRVRRGGDV